MVALMTLKMMWDYEQFFDAVFSRKHQGLPGSSVTSFVARFFIHKPICDDHGIFEGNFQRDNHFFSYGF